MGLTFPERARAGRRLRQERRRHRRAGGARLRPRRDRHGHRRAAARQRRPRLFRLPADRAVVNRMGFNNDGAEVVARRLALARAGRSRRQPVARGQHRQDQGRARGRRGAVLADYGHERAPARAVRRLPGRQRLLPEHPRPARPPGGREAASRCSTHVREAADRAVADRRVPLLVKIAPDLADEDVLAVADLAAALGLDGIIATNTTDLPRPGCASTPEQVEAAGAGGLSGAPLQRARARGDADAARPGRRRSHPGRRRRHRHRRGRPEPGSTAGADLLQAYTAFIYEGPGLARRCSGLGSGRRSPSEHLRRRLRAAIEDARARSAPASTRTPSLLARLGAGRRRRAGWSGSR